MGKDIASFMAEEKTVNKWFVLKVALVGGFCGALLATAWILFGLA